MLIVKIDAAKGLIMIEPHGPLEQQDFQQLTSIVDAHLEENVALRGIMIRTRDFPGWGSFAAFVDHIRFVREHHKLIARIALVTDSSVGHLAPALVRHFIQAEVRHFGYDDGDKAMNWLTDKV